VGTHGYPADTPGYPEDKPEEDHPSGSGPPAAAADLDVDPATAEQLDLERFLHPREAARLIASDQPIAHEGKAGWAVERSTQRAIWIGGITQWDVLERRPGAPRDEPGLTDLPEHGGLPEPAPADEELARGVSESRRKRVQIGLKLTYEQADELDDAAELFGVSRTTLARLLVVRGAREIVARTKG
jgi:hypothetical protein